MTEGAKEYGKHFAVFWTDLLYLMASKPQSLSSTGPLRSMASNTKKLVSELIEANRELADFGAYLTEYYRQMGEVWTEAQKKVDVRAAGLPQDQEMFEAYKRVWVDTFENDFTELFDSEEFGRNYGRMVSRELDLARRWNNMSDVVLKAANLPNRRELDEVYRELHSLRKRVAALESDRRRRNRDERGRA